MLESTDEQAGQPPPGVDRLEMRRALEKSADHDPGLHAGERGADAEVRALAKADVPLAAGAVQPKFVGIVEM